MSARTSGPGLLTRAMAIDARTNGKDLLSEELFISESASAETFQIVKRPRVGVEYAKQWAGRFLRYCIKGNPFVSRP